MNNNQHINNLKIQTILNTRNKGVLKLYITPKHYFEVVLSNKENIELIYNYSCILKEVIGRITLKELLSHLMDNTPFIFNNKEYYICKCNLE